MIGGEVSSQATEPCPSCGASLPVVQPYITWCDQCGWNITAPERPFPAGRFDRLYEQAGRRGGERMERELTAADELEPELTAGKAFAYVIAAGVHLLTLVLLAGGVLLIALFPTKIFAVAAGVLMIGVALVVRPRFGKVPDEDLVARAEAPALYRLIDQVADAADTKTADLLVVDEEYNAGWAILSLRRRRVLDLGLPLLSALEPQERVALVAHEVAHARNGDASRGLFVGSAVRGLAQWYFVLAPHRARSSYDQPLGTNVRLAEHVANGMLWLLSRPPLLLFRLEVMLLLQDSRRAEYLADAIAAREAGSDAVVAVHEKLLLEGSFQQLVRQYAHPSAPADDLFTAIRPTLAAVPGRERERRRRVAQLEASSLGSTHPPTGQRIRLLEQRPVRVAKVVLTSADSDDIDRELARLRPPLQRRLVENHRASLYRR
jgi:Zn-dependent protease with chaperone function